MRSRPLIRLTTRSLSRLVVPARAFPLIQVRVPLVSVVYFIRPSLSALFTDAARVANCEFVALILGNLCNTPRARSARKWCRSSSAEGKSPLMNCPHVSTRAPPPNYMLIIVTTYTVP